MARTLLDKAHQRLFDALYARSLVYNTCWEDPAVDRVALNLQPSDVMLVITSAGCNVLDYALTGVRRIHAVDANPRQTALLELKLAGIRGLDFDDFFAMFGAGHHPGFVELYRERLRESLSPFAQRYWDAHGRWLTDPQNSFYFFGLSGRIARMFRLYLAARPKLRHAIEEMFESGSLEAQREIYDARVAPHMWNRSIDWVLSRRVTMSMLGVPGTQHAEVCRQHPGGVPGFVREAIDYVFRMLPISTNYFWSVYFRGMYRRHCAPEYLRAENFAALKAGLAARILPASCTVTQFLQTATERISKFVLLDHMDWMANAHPQELTREWAAIVARAAPGARAIFRSARREPAYLRMLPDGMRYHPALADDLQRADRVHTYAGFHIADVPV